MYFELGLVGRRGRGRPVGCLRGVHNCHTSLFAPPPPPPTSRLSWLGPQLCQRLSGVIGLDRVSASHAGVGDGRGFSLKKDPVDPPCAWTVLYFCLPVKLVARPSTTHGHRDAHVSVPGSCVPRPYPPVPGCLFPVPRCLCIHSPRFVCPAGCGAKVTPECHDVVLLTESSSGVEPEQPPVPQAAFAAASQRPILGTAQRAEDDVLPSALGPSPRAGSRRLGEGTAGSIADGPPGELTVRA